MTKKQLIGQGSFGEVYVGTFLGSPCAIKTMLPKLQAQPKLVKQFVEEILLMSTLRHPNVVMFLGACTKVPNLSMVLEFCDHGSLHDFLKREAKHGIKITMSLIFRFALDVARGVYYLHRKCKVVQRDLKARNVLVDKSLNAKVADFGLSRVLGETDASLTACGTPAWTAPEIIRNIASGERYTEKVDVYSFGIIMWELVARRGACVSGGGGSLLSLSGPRNCCCPSALQSRTTAAKACRSRTRLLRACDRRSRPTAPPTMRT